MYSRVWSPTWGRIVTDSLAKKFLPIHKLVPIPSKKKKGLLLHQFLDIRFEIWNCFCQGELFFIVFIADVLTVKLLWDILGEMMHKQSKVVQPAALQMFLALLAGFFSYAWRCWVRWTFGLIQQAFLVFLWLPTPTVMLAGLMEHQEGRKLPILQ